MLHYLHPTRSTVLKCCHNIDMASQRGSTLERDAKTVAAVVLAAGAGSRFFGPHHKLLTKLGGKPLVCHAIDAARACDFDEVIVVSGCVGLEEVVPSDVTLLHNDAWEKGQATSLLGAVVYAAERGHCAVVVGLGDQPSVGSGAWQAMLDCGSELAAADFGEGARPPVRLGSSMWASLPVEGDEGARRLWRQRPDMLDLVVCEGDPTDIDTLEDLHRWS